VSSLAIQQQGVVGFDTLKVKTMDITSIILKVSSICNLNCKYCYLFNKSDKSHLRFLNTMPHEVVVETLKRIDDFLKTSKAKSIELTFLGGEPLIVGIDFYNDFFALAKKYILSGKVKYSIQTNGTLLNLEWINLFKAHDVSIGVSLDGDENANKNRITKSGESAFRHTLKGIKLALSQGINVGVLSVIPAHTSPHAYYSFFKKLGIQYLDCLIHDATYETYNSDNRGFGMWLCQLYDIWINDKERISIRTFESIIRLLCNPSLKIGGEILGNSENGVIDITPNGNITIPDTMLICGEHYCPHDLSVFSNKLDDIFSNPIFKLYYNSHKNSSLGEKCKKCCIKNVCGGGMLAHRFSKERGFSNPSVYCFDLFFLIKHIQNDLLNRMDISSIEPLTIQDFNF